jgi:hypothetical protein
LQIVAFGAISLILLFPISSLGLNYVWATTQLTTSIPTYMLITWGNLDQPQGIQGPGYINNYQFLDINQLFESCPSEAVIFVHGWGIDQNMAEESLGRVKMSLDIIDILFLSLVSVEILIYNGHLPN